MLAVRIIGLGLLAFFGVGISFFILSDNGRMKAMMFLTIWMTACICAASCLFTF